MTIPPSIAAPHLLRWSPRSRLLLSHRLFRRNGLPSSAAAPLTSPSALPNNLLMNERIKTR